MINKWKIAAMAALMTAGLAAPAAFAQSVDHTGSMMPHYFDSNGTEVFGSWAPQVVAKSRPSVTRRSGLNAFAKVPQATFGSRDPQAPAGGSIGYNEMLRTDQW